MRTSLITLFMLAFGSIVRAQTSPVLEQYIQAGLSDNLMLRQKELDIQKSMESLRQAKALFFPTVQFNANYTVAAGGRKIDFPIGDLLNPVYGTLNQLTQSNNFPMLENQQIQFLPNNFQETKLKFSWPVFNSDLKYNRKIKELVVMSQTAQKAAYEQELRYQISIAYLQYIQAIEARKIWAEALKVLQEVKRFNESLVKNNVATRDIVADADYEISKVNHEIFDLESKQNSAQAYFNFLINRDLQSSIDVDTLLLTASTPVYNREELISEAQQRRKEFEALAAGREAAQTAVALQEANKKIPDFYLGGETGFQGFGYKYNRDQAFILAQVGLTYDIYSGGSRNSKVQEARIDSEKLTAQTELLRQQVALQVTDQFNQLESARNAQMTAEQGQKAAAESFRIVNNKYRAGQVLLLELMNAQNRVTTADLQTLLSWIEVQSKHLALLQVRG